MQSVTALTKRLLQGEESDHQRIQSSSIRSRVSYINKYIIHFLQRIRILVLSNSSVPFDFFSFFNRFHQSKPSIFMVWKPLDLQLDLIACNFTGHR